ncbi:hypothetical protein O6H91_03G029000 [Diphasiastrum complanatum]|uniref:Uncharacterized protein n=1 Tax=Diphasiastrum complanatum TaxID=34168 RepID=A0ACC2E4L1_DIPCM|nr:hypothetical protein O6H91_03G029000 [Diphasiastrum complanatum]
MAMTMALQGLLHNINNMEVMAPHYNGSCNCDSTCNLNNGEASLVHNFYPPFTHFQIKNSALKFSMNESFPQRSRGAMAVERELIGKPKNTKKPVVVIDNYDSFTYNLCQYLGDLGCKFDVYRNDEISVEELEKINPRGILISPGPGIPKDSGISLEVVIKLGPTIPLFGVCMGLQCIGEAFGGQIVRAPNGVMHGKTSPVYYDESREPGLFSGLPNPFTACRYHSLVIEKESFPLKELEVTAWTDDGLIMGVRHVKHRHMQAVQFHPESIITQSGKKIVENFIKIMDAVEHGSSA